MPLSRSEIVRRVEAAGIVAVIRVESGRQAVDVCRALRDGGVTACEITMTTPGALRAIEAAAAELGDTACVGVGSVLDAETARAAILAGASFIFAPTVNLDVIEMAHRYDKAVVPGALTPTEILAAWQAGADLVKLFPANHFGPQYIRDIHGPMPQVKLAPTGGVTLETVEAWIHAGAAALGVGASLVGREAARAGDFQGITKLAAKYVTAVAAARLGR